MAGVTHEINNSVNFIHANVEPATAYAVELITGVGLSICYQIIAEKHGGKLWVNSNSAHGTLIIQIPLEQPQR